MINDSAAAAEPLPAEEPKDSQRTNIVILRVMLTTVVVLVGVIALEAVKQLTLFDVGVWQLQNNAVILIALVTTLMAFFALRQYRRVIQEVEEWQRHSRDKNVRLVEANFALQDAITERQHTEIALRQSEERYALAAHGSNGGLWDWDLKADALYLSPRWDAMLGYDENDAEAPSRSTHPGTWLKRIHADDREGVEAQLEQHKSGGAAHFECQYRLLCKDGTYRWMIARGLAVRDGAGHAYRMAGSQNDIHESKLVEEQLVHNAFYDTLTGLPNRALFMNLLERALARAKRHSDYLFAVLFLDLDSFKTVNDSLGHLAGDRLLVGVAQRLQECLRTNDSIARLGGDEFIILLDGIREEGDAMRVAERIERDLDAPFQLGEQDGQEVRVSASIGIALSASQYDQPAHLVRDADTALYRAKEQGRARYEMFDQAMHTKVVARLQLENELRRAIERHEFVVHYQPIIALNSGRIVGFEALARWQSPERGLVPPIDFIPIAEDNGLIVPIDRGVLLSACLQMREWQQSYPREEPLSISVNLSTKHFSQPGLIDQIGKSIEQTGVAAHSLKLEITESAIMQHPETVPATLHQLRELKTQISMDDFGTGYSSLSYLHRFPLDTLKIDRSFINRLGEPGESGEIVRTIIALAHSLKMDVVAEGVETAEQAAQLNEMGCEYGQGYFFSRPVPVEAAEALLAAELQARRQALAA